MALVGIEAKRNHFEDMFGEGKGLEIEDPNYLYLGKVTANKNTGSRCIQLLYVLRFGKINYSWDNKYLLSRSSPARYHPRLSTPTTTTGSRLFLLDGAYLRKTSWEATRSWLKGPQNTRSYGVNGNDIIANDAFYAKYAMDLDRAAYAIGGGNTLLPGALRSQHQP